MTPTAQKTDVEIRARYDELCVMLDIPSPPTLELVDDRKLNAIKVAGIYVGRHRKVVLVRRLAFDHVIMHELAHHICKEAMGYGGFHGVPFLALVQVIENTFFGGEDEIRKQVGAWPRLYSLPSTRRRVIEEARHLVTRANAVAERTGPTTVWRLAEQLGHEEPTVRLSRWRSRKWWFDAMQTQGGNAYVIAGGVLLIGFIAPIFVAAKLPAPLNFLALMTSIGCLLALCAWTTVPFFKRVLMWHLRGLTRLRAMFG